MKSEGLEKIQNYIEINLWKFLNFKYILLKSIDKLFLNDLKIQMKQQLFLGIHESQI